MIKAGTTVTTGRSYFRFYGDDLLTDAVKEYPDDFLKYVGYLAPLVRFNLGMVYPEQIIYSLSANYKNSLHVTVSLTLQRHHMSGSMRLVLDIYDPDQKYGPPAYMPKIWTATSPADFIAVWEYVEEEWCRLLDNFREIS